MITRESVQNLITEIDSLPLFDGSKRIGNFIDKYRVLEIIEKYLKQPEQQNQITMQLVNCEDEFFKTSILAKRGGDFYILPISPHSSNMDWIKLPPIPQDDEK